MMPVTTPHWLASITSAHHSRRKWDSEYWVTFPSGHTTSFHDVDIIDNGETYPLQDEHLTDFWTRKAEEFIGQQSKDEPFFLYLAYNGPYNLPPLVTREPVNRHAEYYRENVPDFPQEPVHPYLRRAAIEDSDEEDILKEQQEYRDWGVKDAESIGAHGAAPEVVLRLANHSRAEQQNCHDQSCFRNEHDRRRCCSNSARSARAGRPEEQHHRIHIGIKAQRLASMGCGATVPGHVLILCTGNTCRSH